jgi:mono/diheme cytochrome c family protein
MMKPILRYILALLALILLIAAAGWLTAKPENEAVSRPVLAADAAARTRGAAAFLGAGFGGISVESLDSSAIPWKLATAALVLDERQRDPSAAADQATVRRVLRRFGFLFPDRIANLPPGIVWRGGEKPLGITHGSIAPVGGTKVEVANLGCAACHAGVTYDAAGAARPDSAWLGTPNSALDLEAYTQAVYDAMRRHMGSGALLEMAAALYPEMGWRERQSLRWLVMPLAKRRLAELRGQPRPLPFPNGAPGSTNGVAALKYALGAPLAGGGPGDDGVVSVPELGRREWRSALLTDGAYAVPGTKPGATVEAELTPERLRALAAITSFFTVPSMGVHPDKARHRLGDTEAIFAWLRGYEPQPFPGSVDAAASRRGEAVYAARCASCHGDYRWREGEKPQLAAFPNWVGDVGTDPLRARLFDAGLVKAVDATGYRALIDVRAGRGYAAPPLAGLWSSAPYLHNGSVPSLAALLDPAQRPPRFLAGGHALDFGVMGLRLAPGGGYPEGYRPYSVPRWTDTTKAGRGNGGHPFGAELSPAERAALIEYLKLL